eukprot:CAMPEP_0182437184 /NCGR_PEP_ID=MMETSP1167-20130531/84867_1 /TAXON_ID=2988 /ORGANISM="Mallomonas Sp, Strain CCMP3275" /LENGTH=454 /DNA_ID=CAMNT_0024629999 /DNA_START=102 /DNA_END=1467 /DNA_ORIENTATION=+
MEEQTKLNDIQYKNDILLAAKLLCICDLSYKNSLLTDTEDVRNKEQLWIEKLQITEYQVWNHIPDSSKDIATQLITGVISNLSPEYPNPIPFVCVRGTQGYDDVQADVQSAITADLISSKGEVIGSTGMGFVRKLEALLDLQLLSWCVNKAEEYQGLLLCGHSLGGAVSSLISAELRYDYPATFDKYPLKLVTFGCPRVFDKETAQVIDHKGLNYRHIRFVNDADMGCPRVFDKETAQVIDHKGLNYRHIRFVNDADIVTMLPFNKMELRYHSGEPYFATEESNGFYPIPLSHQFDFSPEPPSDLEVTVHGSIHMIDQALRFAAGGGEPHFIAVAGGYMDRIINSNVYKEAVKSLPDLYRESFESLPYDIPPPDELREVKMKRLAEDKKKALEFFSKDHLEEFKKAVNSVLPPPPNFPTLPTLPPRPPFAPLNAASSDGTANESKPPKSSEPLE